MNRRDDALGAARLTDRIAGLFSGEKRLRLIVALGLAGMALILLSQMLGSEGQAPKEVDTATADFVSEAYISGLEEKLTGIVTGMDGVGRARVMVTLENGGEYIYAQEEKRSADVTREGAAEVSAKVYEKENVEQKYILVEQNGSRQPVITTELPPKVQGVVIVCEGADSPHVRQSLINVVTTALNVSSNRVCVVKIDPESDH